MNNIMDFSKCANCGACYNICPVNAICVDANSLFYTLTVDEELCIHCGKCKNICPVNSPMQQPAPLAAYSAIHYDKELLLTSSSGGVFIAIATEILNKGGVVFAAAYTPDFRCVEICSTEQVPVDSLKVSKYVESLVGDTFQQVKAYLEESREVLYCGAPCQIAGLKRYLNKEYKTLLTCDFSCGGFPSHKIYADYLDKISQKLHSKELIEVNFRPKTYGWNNHAIRIRAKNGRQYVRNAQADHYLDLFIGEHRKYSVRDYCLECQFGASHSSDIILADFWKHRSISNILNNNKGISLIIANSEKGKAMIDILSKHMAITVLDLESASYNLKPNQYSTKNRCARERFLQTYKNEGFSKSVRMHRLKNHSTFVIKYTIKKLLGKTQG